MENTKEQIAQAETTATTPTNRDDADEPRLRRRRSQSGRAATVPRTTRQFDLGNGTRLVDMRPSGGLLEIIPEGPGVNFRDVPSMSRNDAILAVLDDDTRMDAERLELIRQITNATNAGIATR